MWRGSPPNRLSLREKGCHSSCQHFVLEALNAQTTYDVVPSPHLTVREQKAGEAKVIANKPLNHEDSRACGPPHWSSSCLPHDHSSSWPGSHFALHAVAHVLALLLVTVLLVYPYASLHPVVGWNVLSMYSLNKQNTVHLSWISLEKNKTGLDSFHFIFLPCGSQSVLVERSKVRPAGLQSWGAARFVGQLHWRSLA